MRTLIQTNSVAVALLGVSLVALVIGEVKQSLTRRRGAAVHDRGSHLLLRVLTAASYVITMFAVRDVPGADWQHLRVPVFVVALVVLWLGMAIRWWAFHTLGTYFTFTVMTSGDQPVVTSGPYRYVRHPGYTGILLMLAGVGLACGNWISLAALILLPLAGLLYRIKVEEAALTATLGDAYRSYGQGRKRLIPSVW